MISSDFPPLGSKPAPREAKKPAALPRKEVKKTGQKQQKLQSKKQNGHPFLECKDDSFNLLDLGRDVLLTVVQHVGEVSQDGMMQLALSNQCLHDIVINNSDYWTNATVTDFKSMTRSSGINAFKSYEFLCQFKSWEGKFVINRQAASKQPRQRWRPTPFEMLEIEITDSGLIMSIWRSPGLAMERRPAKKKAPFLEVKSADLDSSEHQVITTNQTKKMSLRTNCEFSMVSNCYSQSCFRTWTVEGYLSQKGSLLFKLNFLLENEFIFPLHSVTAVALDHKYLRGDGAWPQALPKPGVYSSSVGFNVFVSYTPDTMRLNIPVPWVPQKFRLINVQVASAFVMPLQEQLYLDFDDYMAYEEGLQGNPSQLNDRHTLHIPDLVPHNVMARAWYSPCPPTDWQEGRWKVFVVSENEFVIIMGDSDFILGHLRRRRDII